MLFRSVPITLADMGLVEDVAVDGGRARIRLRVTSPFCMQIGNIQERVLDVVGEVLDVDDVDLEIDDGMAWMPSMMAPESRRRLRAVRPLTRRTT